MKSFGLCFYSILITWKIVNSELYDIDDEVSALDLPKNTEETDIVDPFSLDYVKANKRMIDKQSQFQRSDGVCGSDARCRKDLKQCQGVLENIEFDKLFSKRLINLLLSSIQFKETGDVLSGSVTLSGTKAQIEVLRDFGIGKITTRQVDAILNDMIIPSTNTFADTFTFLDRLLLIIDTYRGISIAALATVVILLWIKYMDWSTGKVVIVFLGVAMLMTYFMTWSRLMKEADLKQMIYAMKHKEPPIQCDPEKMWFWNRVTTYFDERDHCFDYYKSMNFNAFHEVTLSDVTSEVLGGIIFRTIAQIGSSYGLFIYNATKNLPFPVSWIITILLYIFLPVVIYCICGGRIRLWMGVFGVSIGGGESNRNQQQPIRIEILERAADGGLRQQVINTVADSIDDNKLAAGDGHSETQIKKAGPENSGAICSICCHKDSLNKSHVQKDDNLVNKPMESKEEITEKGDGDS